MQAAGCATKCRRMSMQAAGCTSSCVFTYINVRMYLFYKSSTDLVVLNTGAHFDFNL